MITFLRHGQIDRKKWDQCVLNSNQKMVYSLSWYLDLVAPGWCGMVEDDYVSVMAIPLRKKYGVKYIFQPLFAQQLGVYSSLKTDTLKTLEFIKAIPDEINYIDYNLNHLNGSTSRDYVFTKKVNYELDLAHRYSELEKNYSPNNIRNLRRTIAHIEISENTNIQDVINLKRDNTHQKRKASYYEWLNCFMDKIISMKNGFIVGAYFHGKLVAAAFFVLFEGRLYYLIPVSNVKGKDERAMFSILDYVIGKYADTDLVLDFEGSGIQGIARFFAGFGAKPVKYFNLKLNRLPFPFKLFRK
ncbi:MAG: hypothetical protein K9H49_11465 [Bacteroidales bacterium]|nr:hypothetical protein [Bacteroidales bacterium]MCF8390855.1 hypothetical protein [Bacteroidales bacterium]